VCWAPPEDILPMFRVVDRIRDPCAFDARLHLSSASLDRVRPSRAVIGASRGMHWLLRVRASRTTCRATRAAHGSENVAVAVTLEPVFLRARKLSIVRYQPAIA
jgi:hypothetical protein